MICWPTPGPGRSQASRSPLPGMVTPWWHWHKAPPALRSAHACPGCGTSWILTDPRDHAHAPGEGLSSRAKGVTGKVPDAHGRGDLRTLFSENCLLQSPWHRGDLLGAWTQEGGAEKRHFCRLKLSKASPCSGRGEDPRKPVACGWVSRSCLCMEELSPASQQAGALQCTVTRVDLEALALRGLSQAQIKYQDGPVCCVAMESSADGGTSRRS
ncbi:uncharacterized protein LOC124092138 isoform X2 [Marmota monax]|uniref:uncharacterized protein LOC124092138 isoform X2 n=1 Tax=Marmota monax TaxID=9995 RepID=UPI001EB01816|nr:uncharacterized protein LOC124092138 isoform X2 [Marmota monax]